MPTCITCQSNPVNPMITSVEGSIGKSFCSRVCEYLYLRTDLQFISMDSLKRIALSQLGNKNVSD